MTVKTHPGFANFFSVVALAVLSLLACCSARAQVQTNRFRVGVYDSRAVAVAWANSTEFQATLKSIEAAHQKAKVAQNEKRCQEIEAQMKARQHRAHEQAFSTGSVAAIMARVKEHLPEIAKQADVQIIVSKWELNHQAATVEVVDVTDQLVARFHVSERGLKWCREIQQKPPVSLDRLIDSVH